MPRWSTRGQQQTRTPNGHDSSGGVQANKVSGTHNGINGHDSSRGVQATKVSATCNGDDRPSKRQAKQSHEDLKSLRADWFPSGIPLTSKMQSTKPLAYTSPEVPPPPYDMGCEVSARNPDSASSANESNAGNFGGWGSRGTCDMQSTTGAAKGSSGGSSGGGWGSARGDSGNSGHVAWGSSGGPLQSALNPCPNASPHQCQHCTGLTGCQALATRTGSQDPTYLLVRDILHVFRWSIWKAQGTPAPV